MYTVRLKIIYLFFQGDINVEHETLDPQMVEDQHCNKFHHTY